VLSKALEVGRGGFLLPLSREYSKNQSIETFYQASPVIQLVYYIPGRLLLDLLVAGQKKVGNELRV
jgi:hypothetical protein